MTGRVPEPEPLGIILIHGAAVVMNQHALVFLGPSGTGKSTICKTLESFVQVIGDDRLYLIPRGSDWLVADATIPALERALTEEEALNLAGVPLSAVFRIFQSSNPSVTPVDTRQTCRYLSAAFYEFFWAHDLDIQAQKIVFSKIADISRKTAGFNLHFSQSTKIVDIIRSAIG